MNTSAAGDGFSRPAAASILQVPNGHDETLIYDLISHLQLGGKHRRRPAGGTLGAARDVQEKMDLRGDEWRQQRKQAGAHRSRRTRFKCHQSGRKY